MDRLVRKYADNLIVVVECRAEPHKRIIQSTVAKRAYQIFEVRGCKHGFDLEDWMIAEKELLHDDFDGNTSEFHFFFECPRDPKLTTILSLTTNSLVVSRSQMRLCAATEDCPEVLSVHVLPEEIDPTQTHVKAVDGLFHVYIPKKNNHKVRRKHASATDYQLRAIKS